MSENNQETNALVDRFGRTVDYIRLSVTDRCDFRCVYCMGEEMTFLPHAQVLSLEEIEQVAAAFVSLGVKKIRLTGGEPLVRREVIKLIRGVGQLDAELAITTNGSQLVDMAQPLKDAGVNRLNISIDSLQEERFKEMTRIGKLPKVLAGIDAAIAAGFDRIKLNAVVMKGRNDDEVLDLVNYARDKGIDVSFIEEMPLGNINEHDRAEVYCSSDEVREMIESRYPLQPTTERTAGPSRYYRMADSESRVGFISPHSHNFCSECNRVRVTVEGRLLLCLGNEHSVDLREILRRYPNDQERLRDVIIKAMDLKPEKHEFDLDDKPQIIRFMNMTGG
ncbi:GTP 3',8-cyclase MoaA [Neptuniibacter caesariensis]|uniref:GTP 3',8-cyclase n=1 Tax=Neptuniibacter caesariensis TaxID=207954 RepID=A0A7U8GSK3_NEPCE|nr:GTP 3',8-cyclase MoaA [Neptuniibacter caesariensis]EAR61496.1 molybdenum cofactor biosynthesis protein A [Oceanospirillum sp. MED92] [Neptuniibacter caesariensis]